MPESRRVIGEASQDPESLKLFVCTDHDKHEIEAKCASIIWAQNEDHAKLLLDEALKKEGLRPYAMWRYRLERMDLTRPFADVLNDGDY